MIPPHNIPALERKKKGVLDKRPSIQVTRPIVNPVLNEKLFQMKEDVPNINHRLGINVNPNMVANPCITINERNGVVVRGKGIGFDETDYNTTPINWNNKLAFVNTRFGTTADFSQKDHLAINSYIR